MSDESEQWTVENPADILSEGADVFREKTADYGNSWWKIGEVLYTMAGEQDVTLSSPADWVRAGLYTRRLDKQFRSFNGEFRSDELNFEGVEDSHADESVYAAMHAATAQREQSRSYQDRLDALSTADADETDEPDTPAGPLTLLSMGAHEPSPDDLVLNDADDTSVPLVYLAGPVQHAPDAGEGWRDDVTETWADHIDVLNPLDKYNVPGGDVEVVPEDSKLATASEQGYVTPTDIVEGDKAMVDNADALLVYWAVTPAAGTPMEVIYAYYHDIPVHIVYDVNYEGVAISPWMDYHATSISPTFAQAINTLRNHHYQPRSAPNVVGDRWPVPEEAPMEDDY